MTVVNHVGLNRREYEAMIIFTYLQAIIIGDMANDPY